MLATSTIADEILELKKERRAILLAHHYQDTEIQELADDRGQPGALA
jgi:Quinolinate synthase